MRKFTQADIERAHKVIDMMAGGKRLQEGLDLYRLDRGDFFRAVHTCDELEHAYFCAQQARAESMVEELTEIADTEPDPMRARIRIDTRRWVASKIKASKYGEKLDIQVNQTVNLIGAIEAARSRVIELPKQNIRHVPPALGQSEEEDIFS